MPKSKSLPGDNLPRLIKSLPSCAKDGSDTDFRWVSDQKQAARIAGYELAREVFLVADALVSGNPAQHKLFQKDVASGEPYLGMFHPADWPAEYYVRLLEVAGSKRLQKFNLPPAIKLLGQFAPTKPNRNNNQQAICIRRVQDCYDQHDAAYGPDALYELSVSRVEQFSLVQAVKEFEQWAARSGYFDLKNPGGRPPATLLHLAYFRFMKDFNQKKPEKWFTEAIKTSALVPAFAPATKYGKELYSPCFSKVGVSASSWSEAVTRIGMIVMPAAERIASAYLAAKR
jgi:hypothetical protein